MANDSEITTERRSDGPVRTGVSLLQQIGLVSATSFVVGTMIGSGIFVTPQYVLRFTGSVGLCLVMWAVAGIISILGTLTYVELASVVRQSGGEYAYYFATLGPIPAFIFVFTVEVAMYPAAAAVGCLTFAEYVDSMLYECGNPQIHIKLVAVTVIITVMLINCYSVLIASRFQVFFTAAKLIALMVIIIGGLIKIGQGFTSELSTGFEGTVATPTMTSLSIYYAMFAYGGWNNIYYILEEVKNPRRNVVLASVGGATLTTVVYVLTNISYLAVLSKRQMFMSHAVATTWANEVLGKAAIIIPISVLMSSFGSVSGGITASTRTAFAAARDGIFPKFMSYINVNYYTPIVPIMFRSLMAIFMISQGSITTLISFMAFLAWFFTGSCALCVIILRFKRKDDPNRIKIPIVIPVLFLLICIFLLLTPVITDPKLEYLYAALFSLGSIIFYVPFVHFKLKPQFLEKLEMWLQMIWEVVPPHDKTETW